MHPLACRILRRTKHVVFAGVLVKPTVAGAWLEAARTPIVTAQLELFNTFDCRNEHLIRHQVNQAATSTEVPP